jgi:predicted TIM-barrel fold metal-dependent hydrolase
MPIKYQASGPEAKFDRRHLLKCGAATALASIAPLPEFAAQAQEKDLPSVIVDAHCHAGKGLNFAKNEPGLDPWTTFNDPGRVLRQAEEAGISRTVIFPINNHTYERANEEIADYVRKYRGKFIGFAKHDTRTEAGKIRELLLREVQELGLRGLKLHGIPNEEMLTTAAELRIPVLVHPPRVAELVEVVRVYPQVNFILAHLGNFASRDWREHVRAIEATKALPNLYLETSAVVFFEYLEQAVREVPAEKLIFGTDGPLVDQRVEVQKFNILKLPRERAEPIMAGNILRLLAARGQG